MRLCVLHNLYFYNTMMEEIRDAIDEGRFHSYKEEKLYGMGPVSYTHLAGASHVIVTSYVFRDGKINYDNLKRLKAAVGREHLVLRCV